MKKELFWMLFSIASACLLFDLPVSVFCFGVVFGISFAGLLDVIGHGKEVK